MRRRWPAGLRARIVATTGVATLLAMSALVALVWLVLDRAVASTARSVLADRTATVAAATSTTAGAVTIDPAVGRDSVAWVFATGGGQLYGPTGADLDRAAARLAAGDLPRVVEVDDWLLRAQAQSTDHVLVVAMSISGYESTKHLAALVAVGLGVVVAVAVTALNAWSAHTALAPVATMARSAATWSSRDLDRRFDLGPAHDEITELGHVLDGLLDRVSRAIRAEQRLTAELAHELRTPLTVIRAQAELAAQDLPPDGEPATRLAAVVTTTDRLTEIVETLLQTARGEPPRPTATAVDEVTAATLELTPPPGRVRVTVRPAPTLTVAVPLTVAAQALRPVLANAWRYASARVEVAAEVTADGVCLVVADDGPGVPDADRAHLFEPGWRSADSPGTGLGLPLARRVARAAGGDVTLDAGRPTRFRLTLPAPVPDADGTDGTRWT